MGIRSLLESVGGLIGALATISGICYTIGRWGWGTVGFIIKLPKRIKLIEDNVVRQSQYIDLVESLGPKLEVIDSRLEIMESRAERIEGIIANQDTTALDMIIEEQRRIKSVISRDKEWTRGKIDSFKDDMIEFREKMTIETGRQVQTAMSRQLDHQITNMRQGEIAKTVQELADFVDRMESAMKPIQEDDAKS